MEEVYNFLLNESGIKRNDIVVVGVSGGPDSMALLYLMNKLKHELDLFLICAHVDHNVRKESKDERKFLESYCKKEGIFFRYSEITTYGDDNFENEARTFRYNYFDKLIHEYNAKFLLTAHHGDDLIETILMRIVRGSSLKGYSGFSRIVNKEDYKIIRPLITMTKEEIEEFDKENNIDFVIDKTNFDDVHTRNRYRKYVLPFLKNENPNVHLKFLKFSEILLETNAYIDKEANNQKNKVIKEGILDVEKFKELDKIIQTKIIYSILETIYGDDLLIVSDVHVTLVMNLINSNKPNLVVHLPNNVMCTKTYNEVSFNFKEQKDEVYEIEINDIVNLPNGKNIEVLTDSEWTNNFVTRLSSKEVTLPLHVRTKKIGDKIHIKNMKGTKKIKDIFIDEKIDPKERRIWPVVVDAKEDIVWLPGLRKSKFDKDKNEEYDIVLRYY